MYWMKGDKVCRLDTRLKRNPCASDASSGFLLLLWSCFEESPDSYLNTRPAVFHTQPRREENVKRMLPRFSSRRRSGRLPRRDDYLIEQPKFVFNMGWARSPVCGAKCPWEFPGQSRTCDAADLSPSTGRTCPYGCLNEWCGCRHHVDRRKRCFYTWCWMIKYLRIKELIIYE